MRAPALLFGALLGVLWAPGVAQADAFRTLEGHGGPVMGLASDDVSIASASFDNAVGLWSGATPRWLDGHEAAVKTVILIGADTVASAGDDATVRIWDRKTGAERHTLTGHKGKVMHIAASPDGRLLASAGWDGWVGLWDLGTGAHLGWLKGHKGFVNAVAFGDGVLYSASYDGTIVEWRLSDGTITRRLAKHGFGINTLLVDVPSDWLAYGALDGSTRVLRLSTGEDLADLTLDRRPILAMARRPDGHQIAVGDGEGHIMTVETGRWTIVHDFRAALRGPIWALAYTDGGTALAAGGIEDRVFVWPLSDIGDSPQMATVARAFQTDPTAVSNGERQFLRKCSVCHTTQGDGARRAGPTLAGIFGRKAGAVPGYAYTQTLVDSPIIWDDATIDALFDIGPEHYLPGTKMPMQRIRKAEDRADLIDYLRRATAPDAPLTED